MTQPHPKDPNETGSIEAEGKPALAAGNLGECRTMDLPERLREWSNYDDPPGATLDGLLNEAAAEIEKYRVDTGLLKNPAAVHLNMLVGAIAKINLANVKHLYPEVRQVFEALEVCAAPYATPPGTVEQCSHHLATEFQRRMDIAHTILSAAKASS